MNDNGWDGTETVTGQFTGSSSSVSGIATLSSAGPSIVWKWFAPDGSLREEGSTQIENPPKVFPTFGEGPLGMSGCGAAPCCLLPGATATHRGSRGRWVWTAATACGIRSSPTMTS